MHRAPASTFAAGGAWIGALCAALMPAAAVQLPAQAVLGDLQVIDGVKLYPDLQNPSVYYFAPTGVQLKRIDGEPAFSFLRFRYTGTSATGDAETFRGRALLSFTVELGMRPPNLDAVRAELELRTGRSVLLYPLPIVDIDSDLVYTAVADESGSGESGVLAGGYWGAPSQESDNQVWTERTYYLSADPLSADMLWQAYHKGAVMLSLSVSLEARGIKERPQQGAGSGETVSRTVVADAVRIDVSPKHYPRLFREVDIEEKMPAGYTFLDVYCYDFQAEDRPEDLLAVDVEVRGQAVNGDLLVQRVRFTADRPGVYKQQVHFRYAVRLNNGYSFRVIRTYGASGRDIGPWTDVSRWSGVCDVTTVKRADGSGRDARPLDPRLLY